MRSWDLGAIETPEGSRSPVVLHSTNDARAVLIGLDPGQELGDHQVHENAYVVVVAGEVDVASAEETVQTGPGTLFRFEANERRRISTREGARILLLLSPWPGPGHYRGGREPGSPESL